jgi:hypothetical protein
MPDTDAIIKKRIAIIFIHTSKNVVHRTMMVYNIKYKKPGVKSTTS